MIRLGRYSICILDLFTDGRTGRLSASKLWLHIANGISSWIMLQSQLVDWELITAYNGIVGGSYVAILFFKLRYQGASVSDSGSGEHVHHRELDELEERSGAGESKRATKRPVRGIRKNTKGGKR